MIVAVPKDWRRRGRSLFPAHWRRPNLVIGAVLTLGVVATALVSLVWTPHDPTKLAVLAKLQGPSAAHWLGTDHLGRDIGSRLMVGSRNSILVGLIAVGVGVVGGLLLGLLAAARRDWIDDLLMRGADFAFAFPAVLTAIMITALLGPGMVNAILAIALFNIPVFARVARGAAVAIWARDFVQAARAAGAGPVAITFRHVLPNIANILVVQATIQFALAILAEAALSYLGIGTQPPEVSWGRMLFEAQTRIFIAPSLAIYPGLAIAFAVLGLNLLGDGLRDVTDPRQARRR